MKILFLSRLFYPHIGGVEKHVLEVSKILITKGNKITVITEQNSLGLKLNEVIEGIQVFRISDLKNGKFKKFQIWKWFFKNLDLIKTSDIIHCHDVFFWYLPFKIIFPNKKIYTTFHGYEGYPLKKMDILMHKIAEKLSRGNICIGDFIKKWYGTKPNFISYGGVNKVKNSKFPLRSEASKVKSKNSAVFVGRFEEQTGILTYISAIEIIKNNIPDFELLAIGDGELKETINRKIKTLHSRENISKYFEKYNFTFVSGYLSILEAMSARRLVFAVYDNSLKEDYLRMSPFSKHIIISGSSSDLASKIYFYQNNVKKQEQKVEDAYEWVKNRTWEKVVRVYLKLWKL